MPTILIEKQTPQVTVLTLNRPERRNALTIELLSELNAAIKIASDQPDERVIVLRGAGAAFCTGLDLKEAADQTKAHATAEMVANTLIAISQTRLITIAAVHGAAVAGGAGIMSACDFVVAVGSELIEAERANEIGLVNRVVANADLMTEAQKFAQSVLQGAPGALAQTKRLMEELWSSSVKDDVELALKYHMRARESEEAREGIAAFNEKRKPKWIA
ncbi:MAG: hypothetical protein AUG81_01090 [Verrucomicrobia bacterium 13_1_20CM_4_54_11]|nr:MAG: hypothetical protein AUG81_01090 [Verrucomicrobia bacterium 13_1_20CM_4_54_11]